MLALVALGCRSGVNSHRGTVDSPTGSVDTHKAPCSSSVIRTADLHVDLPYQVHYKRRPRDLRRPGSAVTAAGLRRGRVGLLLLSLHLRVGLRVNTRAPMHNIEDFEALLTTGESVVQANPAVFTGPNPVRYLFSIEGADVLTGHEQRLPGYIARGVRVFGLTHALHNRLADSATDLRAPRVRAHEGW